MDFVGQLQYSDTVANTVAKAHCGCKSSATNIVYTRKVEGEGGRCIHKLGPASQGSFEAAWADRAQPQ